MTNDGAKGEIILVIRRTMANSFSVERVMCSRNHVLPAVFVPLRLMSPPNKAPVSSTHKHR